MGTPVVHFEVLGTDAAALQRFYSELFDWTISTDNPLGYGLVDTGVEGSIGGGIGTAEFAPGPMVTFYVGVDDLQATLDKATRLGGSVVVPVTDVGVVVFALFADPEGHVIGLVRN
jgi:predicted enzyme related to lactoylglutathione lyase